MAPVTIYLPPSSPQCTAIHGGYRIEQRWRVFLLFYFITFYKVEHTILYHSSLSSSSSSAREISSNRIYIQIVAGRFKKLEQKKSLLEFVSLPNNITRVDDGRETDKTRVKTTKKSHKTNKRPVYTEFKARPLLLLFDSHRCK